MHKTVNFKSLFLLTTLALFLPIESTFSIATIHEAEPEHKTDENSIEEPNNKVINPMPELLKILNECAKKAGVNINGFPYYTGTRIILLIVTGLLFYIIKKASDFPQLDKILPLWISKIAFALLIFMMPLGIYIPFDYYKNRQFIKEFSARLNVFLTQAFKQKRQGFVFLSNNDEVDKILNVDLYGRDYSHIINSQTIIDRLRFLLAVEQSKQSKQVPVT